MSEKWSAMRIFAFLAILYFLITSISVYLQALPLFLFAIFGFGDLLALILLIIFWTGKLS